MHPNRFCLITNLLFLTNMMTYNLEIQSKNLFYSVRINDVRAVNVYDLEAKSTNTNVSHMVTNGINQASIVTFTPDDDEISRDNQKLNVKLHEEDGENSRVLYEFSLHANEKWELVDQGSKQIYETQFEPSVPVDPRQWQSLHPVTLTPTIEHTLVDFGMLLHALFAAKQKEKLIALQKEKFLDIAKMTEQTLEEVVDDVHWTYDYFFDSDWEIEPLKREDIKVVVGGNNKVFSLVRRDNRPIIISVAPAKPFYFEAHVGFTSDADKSLVVAM